MEKLLVAAVIMTIALGLLVMTEADRCVCPVKHPQQTFCDSDFVFVATVQGAINTEGYMVYDMKVSHGKVYKGEEFIDRANMYTEVFTSYNGGLCGRPNLVYKEKYLITGMMVDGHLEISYCNWVTEWTNVSPSQLKYLKRGIYANQCDSCNIAGIYSAHNYDMNDDVNTYHESQLSGKWSRYHCTYNPAASMKYMKYDCEDQFAYCTRDIVSGSCVWKDNEKYSQCFDTRETAWVSNRTKQPAFTSVSQCRVLSNRRWKKKCFRAVRRHRQSTGARATIEELPLSI